MTVADDTGLPMVIINVWLPHGALPVYEEPGGGEEPPVDPNSGRKPLETLMLQVPKRLRMSQPFRSIKKLGIMIEETKARIEKKAAEAEGNGGKESASTEDLKEPLPEENLAEKLSTAENDFETNKTIYESLTTNLCKEQYTTIGWIESLMSYNAVGMTAVVPGGALCSVDKFGMKSEAVLNGVSRVLAEFVKQVGFEKSDGSVIPRFSPRLYDYVVASSIAEKWVNTQCFVLGVDALEHVVLCWHDDAVPGVGECVKALRAVCAADGEFVRKVKHVTLSNATEQSIRQCMIEGGKPDAAILPALEMFTCKGEGLRAQCAKLRIPIIVDNVLLGGLVDERYLRMRTPPDLATLRGTAAFDSLGVICNVVGGWERFQGILSALEDTKHGVANAAIEYFIGAGMRCIVETILDGPPWFMLGGDSLLEADRENITAALRAYAALG